MLAIFIGCSKWETTVCDITVCLRHFCQAGEADIQDYAPAQDIFTWTFLHIIITDSELTKLITHF